MRKCSFSILYAYLISIFACIIEFINNSGVEQYFDEKNKIKRLSPSNKSRERKNNRLPANKVVAGSRRHTQIYISLLFVRFFLFSTIYVLIHSGLGRSVPHWLMLHTSRAARALSIRKLHFHTVVVWMLPSSPPSPPLPRRSGDGKRTTINTRNKNRSSVEPAQSVFAPHK